MNRKVALAIAVVASTTQSFTIRHRGAFPSRSFVKTYRHFSSIGGENGGTDDNNEENPLNEWFGRKEDDESRQSRERFSETSLPMSYYGAMDEETYGPIENNDNTLDEDAVVGTTGTSTEGSNSSEMMSMNRNPYLDVVSKLAPADVIARFTATASPRVQDAVRTTVLGLIGGLPQMAFETKTIATGERLASLMFQLQMTGYMFKNAEYRLSLNQSLGGAENLLPGTASDSDSKAWRDGKPKGKIKVKFDGGISITDDKENEDSGLTGGLEVEVDAQAYMSELTGEVARLRDELYATRQSKEEQIRQDLLLYIRTLPQQELRDLTSTMSPEVLAAMKGLITAVLAGIGGDNRDETSWASTADGGAANGIGVGPETVTEQSGEALAQLCMWQLVVGFNLRELEVRENMTINLLAGGKDGGEGEFE
mmetsp:Transcript_5379/g.11442  ORF Transcript_5379/g.11442 Transcript_5379/m.11442 type:complete len:424 (+) Transcript_5379:179-1450(+)